MDRQTHRTGRRTVKKRFILCLGMQEVSKLLTSQGGIQGRNIQNDADRDVIFALSVHESAGCFCCWFICATVSNVYRKSQWRPRSMTYIQGGKEKQVCFKSQHLWHPVMASLRNKNTKPSLIWGHFSLGWYMNMNWGCEQERKKVLDSSQ